MKSRFGKYTAYEVVGDGTYATVYRANKSDDRRKKDYALKVVHLTKFDEKEKQNIMNEIAILAKIKHPNILALEEAFVVKDKYLLW